MRVEIRCKYDEMVAVNVLKPNPANPNKHPGDQIDELVEQFQYQGFRHPIIVSNQTALIVVGHGRLEAAKSCGMKFVPVTYQDFTNPDQEYAFMVADNSISDWATLDLMDVNASLIDLGPDFEIERLAIKGFTLDMSEKEAQAPLDETKKKCPECGAGL